MKIIKDLKLKEIQTIGQMKMKINKFKMKNFLMMKINNKINFRDLSLLEVKKIQ